MYEHIGLVTSPRGDAVHDVMRTMRRRFPLTRISLAGVAVEGAHAATGMAEALASCAAAGCEAILLVRGGGSFEDLMPFNDESLARAIAGCPVPVVTGIGHEPDTTIADMVADVRASTPTAAAERVTPDKEALDRDMAVRAGLLSRSVERTLARLADGVGAYASRPVFKDPRSLFATDLMTVDMLHDTLVARPSRVFGKRPGDAGVVRIPPCRQRGRLARPLRARLLFAGGAPARSFAACGSFARLCDGVRRRRPRGIERRRGSRRRTSGRIRKRRRAAMHD